MLESYGFKEQSYGKLPKDEEGEQVDDHANRHVHWGWKSVVVHSTLLLTSGSFLAAGLYQNHKCLIETRRVPQETYSPALTAVEYIKMQLNGSFVYESVFKGPPNPELDNAWSNLTAGDVLPGPLISISERELHQIGQAQAIDATVRLPEHLGGGFVGSLEVFHQLHCLNMLRTEIYREYYPPNPDPPAVFKKHIDHCISMLRQHVMCRGDVGVVTGRWVENYSLLYPDFSSWEQCRDFDKIYAWARDHEVKVTPEELKATRGSVSLNHIP